MCNEGAARTDGCDDQTSTTLEARGASADLKERAQPPAPALIATPPNASTNAKVFALPGKAMVR